ncbi:MULTISPECIES: bifunctional UDP-N-acetylglucosamine diphosphorylase/glucosamine-1-phosphate N-acetyltransferase GlmU [Mameliella]|uniref:bifunctional UDP-N-acetylglucosamine diphosphorylase/glucosamine-1-phosphate N-acetyltransferase GlmU n=1 Tax=Mameliella TaxID=1434019 RepID=UPI000B52B071|nr:MULTISPECIES: bifunctional UDP-N-acetylglucosamine diphosphorylase/glucosamine-1-phosphate N-acetyltransferase GlmU [Mameliella]MCR9274527.1 bifunctional UDP-N-acetylglucosamine diphosphorylase/glucosamine-1-phosphate N-acetyltransferase GlmU [Paracoccaceae bacterium]OWV62994.1 UDP-N-acetylglucosamine diphosphorylase/glucosamine-1-phosphate N-acetyltransferase [Mameliella alba]
MSTALIVLAAGKGTRMNSDQPKVLHRIAGAPMLWHALRAGAALEPERTVVVGGHGFDSVAEAARDYDPDLSVVEQAEQLGTGHAVRIALPALEGFEGDVVVLYGDTPFISPDTLEAMRAARATHDVVVLGFEAADPARYGRLVMEGDDLVKIVEFKDATDEERNITLCNSGVIAADKGLLAEMLAKVGNDNASGEYYLTDVPGLARTEGRSATVVRCPEAETLGVNSRTDLAFAEAAFQAAARAELLDLGVTLQAPETVHLAWDTVVGRDAEIEPNVVFGPGVTVESGARIRAFSHLEGCHVSRGAIVGPYARLRPGAELAEDVHVGNFVEVKNAVLHEGVKANHLTYIGDAEIGEKTNIGAGTITCNYDGVFKHRTVIGKRAFIGSDTMLVAPVTIGDGAMTGSGSTITSDVPAGALAIARGKQETKPGLAEKLMNMLRAKKAKQKANA